MSAAVTPDFERQADAIVARYPVSLRSAALPLLHLWQETHGYVCAGGMDWIAARVGVAPINILELVTFYPMFRQQPQGRIHIRVCRTLSCALGGAPETLQHFCRATGVEGDPHGPMHSADGKYTVEYVECLASCGTAPVVMVNEDFHENITGDKVEQLLKQYE